MSLGLGRKVGISVAAAAAVSGAMGAALAEDNLALRRVMLSTGGVGYFEYEGKAAGDAELSLEARLDQVDDILKSIVIFDEQGNPGAVSLPVKEPLREAFRELPFSQEALGSPAALLSALRGAHVRITMRKTTTAGLTSAPETVEGRILSVTTEEVQLPNQQGKIVQHRITVATHNGIRQAILEQAETVKLLDEALAAKIETALAALLEHTHRERRELRIHVPGKQDGAERLIHVGYVVEAPLWKTSYRLALPEQAERNTALIQGFATLENLSGKDWQDVELTVVSGNPVTFRQALYNAYYVQRPEVPIEVLGRVLPPPDRGAIPARRPKLRAMAGEAMAAPAPEEGILEDEARIGALELPTELPLASEAETLVSFQFPEAVTVGHGQSVLLPVIHREIPIARISLYQPNVHEHNPLASVALTNPGDVDLPPGALAIYQQSGEKMEMSYLGDARLGPLPAGEKRIVSFAVDQDVRIDRQEESARTLVTAKLAQGMLEVTHVETLATTYTIAGAATEPRVVVIEHPRMTDWDLAEPAAAQIEVTPDAYRIPVEVAAGQTVAIRAVLQRPVAEVLKLIELSSEDIRVYAAAPQLPDATRQALEQIAKLQANVANLKSVSDNLRAEIKQLADDQARIRANLGAIPAGSDLHQRYIAMLGQQEDQIQNLKAKVDETNKALAQARRDLSDYIAQIEL